MLFADSGGFLSNPPSSARTAVDFFLLRFSRPPEPHLSSHHFLFLHAVAARAGPRRTVAAIAESETEEVQKALKSGGVTVEYQRKQAKEMVKFFKGLQYDQAVEDSQVGLVAGGKTFHPLFLQRKMLAEC
jgi:hypothetical protein